METILCSKCLVEKPTTEYWPSGVKRAQDFGTKIHCRECYRAWTAREKQEHTVAMAGETDRPCKRCGEVRARQEYSPSTWLRVGSWCRRCNREYYRERNKIDRHKTTSAMRRRREKVAEVRALKAQMGCSQCGENHPACLDFHHTDVSKKLFTVAQTVAAASTERIMAEIAKCVLLCSNCHRKLHYARGHPQTKPDAFIPARKNPTRRKPVMYPVQSA